MTISLSDGTTTLVLHPDLLWADKNKWLPVSQTEQRTVTGALIVSAEAMVGGRPITLQPENESSAWMPLTTLTQLGNWAAVPGQALTLTLNGTTYPVIFRHPSNGGGQAAVDATPLVHYSDEQAADWYLITVRLLDTSA
jgi:hypothetical protein